MILVTGATGTVGRCTSQRGRPRRRRDVAPQPAHQAMTEAGMPADVAEAVLALLAATSLEPDTATVHPTVENHPSNGRHLP